MKYRLTCKCGRSFPVETRQAGGVLTCECGETLQIPTMLKMKRLPEWEEGETAESETAPSTDDAQSQGAAPSETASAASESSAQPAVKPESKRGKMSAKRKGLFLAAGLFFIVSAFFLGINVRKPDPRAVFYKQINYRLEDGRSIRRDSSPITVEDFNFYYLQDPMLEQTFEVNDVLIDNFSDFYAYQYFTYVKSLDMSDNFYDNYEGVLTRWRLRLTVLSVVALASLVVALLALFTKESTKQVGALRGDSWR